MSVLIKGMDMPTCCANCDIHNPFADTPYCRRLLQVVPLEGRLENCPLVEIPTPHGRLLDENEVKNTFKFSEDAEYARWTLAGVLMDIEDTEAVLESEE